jgi:MarR family transcriptional regulator, transcriptional regulator for hemolysin
VPQIGRWVDRTLAEHDPPMTVAQYLALDQLDRGAVGASDLARAASVSSSAVSQLVAALRAAGWVERTAAEGDRRRKALVLSEKGGRVLTSARRLLRDRLAPLPAGLPKPEADALARSLDALDAVLTGKPPPRRPGPPKPPARPKPPPPPHRR